MNILGPSTVSVEAAQAWARSKNAHQRAVLVAPLYWQTAPRYGIPAELAFAQAMHETNWGKYTGVVIPEFHNWAGIKTRTATGDRLEDHQRFPSDEVGVLAHVQHLARYAGAETVHPDDFLVDPRWSFVTNFTDSVEGLGRAWAPAADYGVDVAKRTNDLRSFANDGTWPVAAQIPGFIWHPADDDHYDTGRREKIRGGAQHYTAGTNSLTWLSSSSVPAVSVHFLVKHNPTMDDRGWQIVWIENTAWTTAFANPYTVAIEYEHDGRQPIPDIAYDVLAQSWIDIAAYVKAKGLGEIPLTRSGIRGHKEWVNNPSLICPDGIDVDRIVRRIQELIAPDPTPADDRILVEGVPIQLGFRDHFLEIGATVWPADPIKGGIAVFGLPLAEEYATSFGSAQRFERYVMEWHRDNDPPFDIIGTIRGQKMPGPVK